MEGRGRRARSQPHAPTSQPPSPKQNPRKCPGNVRWPSYLPELGEEELPSSPLPLSSFTPSLCNLSDFMSLLAGLKCQLGSKALIFLSDKVLVKRREPWEKTRKRWASRCPRTMQKATSVGERHREAPACTLSSLKAGKGGDDRARPWPCSC